MNLIGIHAHVGSQVFDVSSFERAIDVIAGFAAPPRILFEDVLYLAAPAALMRRLRRLEEGCEAVLVIGHNPGLHELALQLADGSAWGDLGPEATQLVGLTRPRDL